MGTEPSFYWSVIFYSGKAAGAEKGFLKSLGPANETGRGR
jgi:hypothetical protein